MISQGIQVASEHVHKVRKSVEQGQAVHKQALSDAHLLADFRVSELPNGEQLLFRLSDFLESDFDSFRRLGKSQEREEAETWLRRMGSWLQS